MRQVLLEGLIIFNINVVGNNMIDFAGGCTKLLPGNIPQKVNRYFMATLGKTNLFLVRVAVELDN